MFLARIDQIFPSFWKVQNNKLLIPPLLPFFKMPYCEMCGKEAQLTPAELEGVELKVCPNCTRFGKVKPGTPAILHRKKPLPVEEPQFSIVSNYSFLIRSAREKKGMTQEDFAKFLNERESVVSKWESGSLKPSVDNAGRVGQLLKINLVQKEETVAGKIEPKNKIEEFTLGDFIKVRKRSRV